LNRQVRRPRGIVFKKFDIDFGNMPNFVNVLDLFTLVHFRLPVSWIPAFAGMTVSHHVIRRQLARLRPCLDLDGRVMHVIARAQLRLPSAFSKRTHEERDLRLPSRGRVCAGPDR
jgi:hypothetical protein